ncbi:uncharacterized protein LOC113678097 [Pocillopora damicornis]|uniref:uncharacterized protein LOC113678097 n=1 Tax=Pocillopora damicornis TaxID=46731 RepID=UPI000F54DE00|nr:uncharacterized protein LOC113678097 [Pocillopora damicornis]
MSLSKQDVGKSRTESKKIRRGSRQEKKNLIDSDSDEDSFPPKIRKATSVKKEESSKAKKNRRPISLDSDEEEVVPRKLKKSTKQTENVASKEVQQVKESPVEPKEKKATSALDFFGSTSVERESRKTFAKRENRDLMSLKKMKTPK